MGRYAVLLDVHDADLRPIALVTEHDHEVLVHFAVDCGLRSRYTEPYQVTEPDGSLVAYRPGDPEYFNSVITTLARGFVLKELETVPGQLDAPTIVGLYTSKVLTPRARRHFAYATSRMTGYCATATTTSAYIEGSAPSEADGVLPASESLLATAA